MAQKKTEEPPVWLPPAADVAGENDTFVDIVEENFWIPERLADKPHSLVEAVNDFHFAMMNDHDRNAFYKAALQKAIKPTDIVLEIGTGSGLLAMLAAKCNPQHVYAVEANRQLAALAKKIIRRNGLQNKITVINKLSTQVKIGDDLPRKANVLVSEILGTLLLGESALAFVADCRKRLLVKNAAIIPAKGRQFISLIESQDLQSITSVTQWDGIDLSGFEELQDTINMVFTKQYGFRLSTIKQKVIVPEINVAEIDFNTGDAGCLPSEKRMRIKAQQSGTIHAIVAYWEVDSDLEATHVMSTDPEKTKNNFPRDMQWGQAIQLVEDCSVEKSQPVPLVVSEGDELELLIRFSKDSAVMQFQILPVR
eukprot:m.17746 g.17746  ORF g.17746 m.17746 type:complete len:367 (+) comp6098_c0_seq1:360-1460(+)